MHLRFADIYWLIPGLAVVALAAGLLVRAGGHSLRWRVICIALPMAAALAACLALADATLSWSPAARQVVILLDLSASTRSSPWRDPQWVRALAGERLPAATRLTVVGFADRPQMLLSDVRAGDSSGWPLDWTVPTGTQTNLRAAMDWRSDEELRTGALAPRWLITDGLADSPLPAGEVVPFDLAYTIQPPSKPDVAIAELLLKRSPDPAAPTELWVRLRATGPVLPAAKATVEILRDEMLLASQPFSFAGPGDRWLSVRTTELLADHPVRLAARIHSAMPDPWPENDAASLLYVAEGPPRILLVEPAADTHPPLEKLLAASGNRILTIRPAELPLDVSSLVAQGWQIITLDDVSAAPDAIHPELQSLTPAQAHVLEDFVQHTGGGLLIVGRAHAFGPGAYAEGEAVLERLSPLLSQPPKRPAAHIVFLLDASASMNERASDKLPERKFTLTARGVQSALELLKADDTISVLTFNGAADVIASGPKSAIESTLAGKLNAVHPTSTTTPDTALDLLEPLMPPAPPKPDESSTMLVLLTDGEIPKMDLPKWQALLGRGKTALTIVAPQPSPDSPDALKKLAIAVHAGWLVYDDESQWTALLRRAVAERIMGRAQTSPLDWFSTAQAPDPALSGRTTQWIETWPAPNAALCAAPGPASASGEFRTPNAAFSPTVLAATAHRGLGNVAAISFHDDSPAYREFLAQLTRGITPPPGDRRFSLTARREGGRWLLRAEGRDERGFLNDQSLSARILTAADDRAAATIALPQVAPGVYEASVDAGDSFAAIITRKDAQGDTLVGQLRPPWVATSEYPASVEPAALPEDATFLDASEKEPAQWAPRLTGWTWHVSNPLWVLAILFSLAALWLRRGRQGHGG